MEGLLFVNIKHNIFKLNCFIIWLKLFKSYKFFLFAYSITLLNFDSNVWFPNSNIFTDYGMFNEFFASWIGRWVGDFSRWNCRLIVATKRSWVLCNNRRVSLVSEQSSIGKFGGQMYHDYICLRASFQLCPLVAGRSWECFNSRISGSVIGGPLAGTIVACWEKTPCSIQCLLSKCCPE